MLSPTGTPAAAVAESGISSCISKDTRPDAAICSRPTSAGKMVSDSLRVGGAADSISSIFFTFLNNVLFETNLGLTWRSDETTVDN